MSHSRFIEPLKALQQAEMSCRLHVLNISVMRIHCCPSLLWRFYEFAMVTLRN